MILRAVSQRYDGYTVQISRSKVISFESYRWTQTDRLVYTALGAAEVLGR